jgi:hypothetical protein
MRKPGAPTRDLERDFQEQVIELARYNGFKLIYHTYDSRRSAPGFPDLVLCRPPRLIFAELKSESGGVTVEQQRWLEALWESGVEAFLWRPSDLDAIARILSRSATPSEASR